MNKISRVYSSSEQPSNQSSLAFFFLVRGNIFAGGNVVVVISGISNHPNQSQTDLSNKYIQEQPIRRGVVGLFNWSRRTIYIHHHFLLYMTRKGGDGGSEALSSWYLGLYLTQTFALCARTLLGITRASLAEWVCRCLHRDVANERTICLGLGKRAATYRQFYTIVDTNLP